MKIREPAKPMNQRIVEVGATSYISLMSMKPMTICSVVFMAWKALDQPSM